MTVLVVGGDGYASDGSGIAPVETPAILLVELTKPNPPGANIPQDLTGRAFSQVVIGVDGSVVATVAGAILAGGLVQCTLPIMTLQALLPSGAPSLVLSHRFVEVVSNGQSMLLDRPFTLVAGDGSDGLVGGVSADVLVAEVNADTASVSTAVSSIVAEVSARAAGDSSASATVVSLSTSLSTGLSTTAAGVSAESAARSSADVALAATVSGLSTSMSTGLNSEAASIATESGARSAADTAVAATVTSLSASVSTGLASSAAGVSAESAARSSADVALAATVTGLSTSMSTGLNSEAASIATESGARSAADTAVAATVTSLSASVSTGLASSAAGVTSEATARASADTALAATASALSASISSAQVSVASTASAVATLDGEAIGAIMLMVNTGNRITGMRIIGASGPTDISSVTFTAANFLIDGVSPLSFNSGTGVLHVQNIAIDGSLISGAISSPGGGTEIDIGNGRIVFDNGSYMRVMGDGFGASNDLIDWYGPHMAISACTRSNATFYLGTDGTGYSGLALSAGTSLTSANTTDTSTAAVAETAVFGSAGGTITVTLTYSYSASANTNYAGTSAGLTAFNSAKAAISPAPASDGAGDYVSGPNSDGSPTTIDLYRSINGGGYALVGTLSTTGAWTWSGTAPLPSASEAGFAIASDAIGGSLTYTDGAHLAQNRQFKAVLNTRNVHYSANIVQTIKLTCVE